MTSVDDYLARVRGAMRGMDPSVREDILKELRAHLAESTAANGGNIGVALAGMGDPKVVGREYKRLYGYGLVVKALSLTVSVALAIPTVPVLRVTEASIAPYSLSLLFLGGLAAWLLWTGARAGARVGLMAGIAACVARLVAVGAVGFLQPGASAVPEGLALFLGVSLGLVLLGWLPGTAKKVWQPPRPEL